MNCQIQKKASSANKKKHFWIIVGNGRNGREYNENDTENETVFRKSINDEWNEGWRKYSTKNGALNKCENYQSVSVS